MNRHPSPPPMATSDARIQANRRNAQKSTGPKTASGKEQSRRNALKHGLTGEGTVLPEDLQLEVAAEVAIFSKALKPNEGFERVLVDQAALASVRRTRAFAAAEAGLRRRQRDAVRDWDEARDAQVAEL